MGGKAVPPPKPIFPVWLNEDECETINNIFTLIPTDNNLANIVRKIKSAQAAKKIGSGRE